MPHAHRLLALALLLAACSAMPVADEPPPASTGSAPATLDPEPLIRLVDGVRESGAPVHHVTVIHRGETALAADFYPLAGGLHDVASVTKSITSTLVGIAVDRGQIESVDAPVLGFFPDVPVERPSARLERLTLRHLLTMTSGFCSDFAGGEAQLDAMRHAPDAVAFMLNQPLLHEPGEHFAYCSGASQLLSAVVTQATGEPMEAYAAAHLFGPLGITEVVWPADPQGNNTGWGDLFIRPADLAKIGQLFLQRGVWEGERLVSEAWIDRATRQQVADGDEGYGFRWWIPNEAPGLYEGRGRGGQRLVVWPDEELVVVMIGSGFDPGALGGPIVEALRSDAPPTPEGRRRLREAVARAATPPPPGPTAPLPETARSISGRRYALEPNPVGITAFQLDFPEGADEATFTLALDSPRSQEHGDRVTAVGLDGHFRISPSGRFGLPLAARGHWEDGATFRMVYDEIGGNHVYDLVLRFDVRRATLSLREGTGLADVTLQASASP